MTDEPAAPDQAEVPDQPDAPPPQGLSEEELRAAYEAELKSLRVEDLVAQTIVSLLNLGARKAALLPDTDDEADPVQLGVAIEGIRRLLPLVEPAMGENVASIKDALAQLQVAFTRIAGEQGLATAPAGEAQGDDAPAAPAAPGAPAQGEPASPAEKPSSGLWTPGP